MYDIIFKQTRRNDHGVFSIRYGIDENLPWALTVENAEHRFNSLTAALDFAKGNGWIDNSEHRLILIILFSMVTQKQKIKHC